MAIASAAGPDAAVHMNLTDFYHNQLHLIGVDTQKLTGPEIVDLMNHLRQAGVLHVWQPETNRFDNAVEAYTKIAKKR
jgi:hypothetical protein